MPLFFIDMHDGEAAMPDLIGHEFPDAASACAGALAALPASVRHTRRPRREVTVAVRDEAGLPLLRAALSLVVRDGVSPG